jgi:hypothetical protein
VTSYDCTIHCQCARWTVLTPQKPCLLISTFDFHHYILVLRTLTRFPECHEIVAKAPGASTQSALPRHVVGSASFTNRIQLLSELSPAFNRDEVEHQEFLPFIRNVEIKYEQSDLEVALTPSSSPPPHSSPPPPLHRRPLSPPPPARVRRPSCRPPSAPADASRPAAAAAAAAAAACLGSPAAAAAACPVRP